jgi:hypothetical protein
MNFAYIDPGTGSLFLQAIIGVILGVIVFFRNFFIHFFRRSRSNTPKPKTIVDEE